MKPTQRDNDIMTYDDVTKILEKMIVELMAIVIFMTTAKSFAIAKAIGYVSWGAGCGECDGAGNDRLFI